MDRKLDGFNIRVQDESGARSVCLSDASDEQRHIWLSQLDRDRLLFVANELAKIIRLIGDELDIHGNRN